jgi:hypothetical protein
VTGVRLFENEKAPSHIMLVDASHRIIALSDGLGIRSEKIAVTTNGAAQGCYQDLQGATISGPWLVRGDHPAGALSGAKGLGPRACACAGMPLSPSA